MLRYLIEFILILGFLFSVPELVHSELSYLLSSLRVVQKSISSHIVVIYTGLFEFIDSLIESAINERRSKDRYCHESCIME